MGFKIGFTAFCGIPGNIVPLFPHAPACGIGLKVRVLAHGNRDFKCKPVLFQQAQPGFLDCGNPAARCVGQSTIKLCFRPLLDSG